MSAFLRKLFERYAKRMLTHKVRPSLKEEGIMTIPNEQRVKKWAENLYKDLKAAGVTDNMIKTENDIKVLHSQVAEINNKQIIKKFEGMMKPKESADVFDLTGKKIDTSKPILGGKNVPESIDLSKYDDDALNALVDEHTALLAESDKLSEAGINYGRVKEIEARRKEIREILKAAQDIPPSGYGNIKADLVLKKQGITSLKKKDPFQGWTPKVIEGGGTSPDNFLKLKEDTYRRLMMNTDDDVKAFGKRII